MDFYAPLRATIRFICYGHFDAIGERGIFQLARYIGRKLPFPIWLKARVRAFLIRWRFSRGATFSARVNERRVIANRPFVPVRADKMLADRCGLMPNLVSVVLPVYNQINLLEESIESVLAQRYENFELIVINDGSTDGVEALLGRYLDHPKVRCYTQSNQRLPKALSNGFQFARGEFWTWTSADNIMDPGMLELMVAKLQAESDLGMVYADYYAIDDRGALLQDRTWRAHNRPDPASGEIRLPRSTAQLNTVQDNFIGPCFMYRGWVGRCLGDYDPQLGIEDYDYWMRINTFFPLRHLGRDDLLYRYRVHDNTLSAQASEHRILEKVRNLMRYERERDAFYRKAPTMLVDAPGADWLRLVGDGLQAECMPEAGDAARAAITDSLDLLVLGSETAVRHLNMLCGLATPVAILFAPDDQRYLSLQCLLNRPGCVALVASRLTADRIRLVAQCPLLDMESAQSYVAVLAFARNHRFLSITRTGDELKRQLPRQLLQPAGRHVLLQVDNFTQGGLENVVIDLGLSLQEAGFVVSIGNLGHEGDAAHKARDRGLQVVTFQTGITPTAYVDWLRQHHVELVNAHYSLFAVEACRQAGLPFIETIHNAYVWLDPQTVHRYREMDPYISLYICVSKTAAHYADVVLGLDVSKMLVVANGIDVGNIEAASFEDNRRRLRDEWQVGAGDPVFLNVASIMATKAQLPLVKAFSRVARDYPSARLVLLGKGLERPYQLAVEKAVRDLGLADKVIFAGYHREVAEYYHAADAFVLPSYWEGWSLSLGEAMANGLPCVITNVGSAYEFEGHSRVKIVQPPFGDITNLNFQNLGHYVYGEDEGFIASLADAMRTVVRHPRGVIDTDLAASFDRRLAYARYAEIFLGTSVE